MNEIQSFTIDVPVSANQRLIRSKTGKALIESKRYRVWFERAVWSLKAQRTRPTLNCRLGVSVVLHFSDKRRRDLDNVLKGFLDAMTHAGVWEDDSQIDKLHIVRAEPSKPGKLIAHVWELLDD